MSLLELNNVTKKYGRTIALKDVSLKLDTGKISALLGDNGSGKTTLLKLAAGIMGTDEGDVRVNGKSPVDMKSVISYMPDTNITPVWMNMKDASQYYYDYFMDFDRNDFKELCSVMGIKEESRIRTMSKGMVEKFNLALCLARKASLYLLDEPLGGVDLIARDDILNMIVRRFREDSCIVISTHLIGDIEKYVDNCIFLKEGVYKGEFDVEEERDVNGKSLSDLYREVMKNG